MSARDTGGVLRPVLHPKRACLTKKSQKEMERRERRRREGRPTPTERAQLPSAVVSKLPKRGGEGMWASSRAFRRIRQLYEIPKQDLDLWYCDVRLEGSGDDDC